MELTPPGDDSEPPIVPPRRPLVGTAMGDDDNLSQLHVQCEQLQGDLLALCARLQAAGDKGITPASL